MSRYLQHLVQRAAGRGPWAAVVPPRLPTPAFGLYRPILKQAESEPSPPGDGASSTAMESSAARSPEAQAHRGQDQSEPAGSERAFPAARPMNEGEAVSIQPLQPSRPTPVNSSAAEVSMSGSIAEQEAAARTGSEETNESAASEAQQLTPSDDQRFVTGPRPAPVTATLRVPAFARGETEPAAVQGRGEPRGRISSETGEAAPETTRHEKPQAPAAVRITPAVTAHRPFEPERGGFEYPSAADGETAVSASETPTSQAQSQRPPSTAAPRAIPESVQAPRPLTSPPASSVAASSASGRQVPPKVQVRIGRVEIRPAVAQQQMAPPVATAARLGGFDDYLSLRTYRRQDY